MTAFKRLIAAVGGGILGLVLLVVGVRELLQTKALQSKGKSTVGEVTKAEQRRGRRGRRSYYVTAHFKTAAGQTINSRERVRESVYDEASSGGTVKVTYLPDKPAVCRFGPGVNTEWANIGIGAFLLGCAGVAALRRQG
jgi:hypothetical protein